MAEKYAAFECPSCGSPDYESVRVQRSDRTTYVAAFFQCTGCSIMFADPVKFTTCGAGVAREEATPRSLQDRERR